MSGPNPKITRAMNARNAPSAVGKAADATALATFPALDFKALKIAIAQKGASATKK